MIKNFSDSIRRNQRQWMVVVTILAVFAFVFDDLVRGGRNGSVLGNVIMIGGLFAAGMAIVGYSRQKTMEFASTGFVVGGLVAYIAASSAQPPAAVRTSFGALSNEELNSIGERRMRVHRFLNEAVTLVEPENTNRRAPSFGGTDMGSLVSFAALRKEAERMGVSVSEDGITAFINKATQEKLSAADFRKALVEAKIQESELYTILRDELSVQLVAQLTSAPADAQPLYGWRLAIQTPEQLWTTYRKLKVKQGVSFVALPVAEFTSSVSEPTESEIKEFFDKYKNNFGNDEANPGFMIPPKVQIAYLAASANDPSKLEDFEKQAAKITEQEVLDYYTKNKENYRIRELPGPSGSDLPDLNSKPTGNDVKPADATKTDNSEATASEGKKDEGKPESKEEAKPEKTSEKPGEPATEKTEEKPPVDKPTEKKEDAPKSEAVKEEAPCSDDAAKDEKKESESKDEPSKVAPAKDPAEATQAKPTETTKDAVSADGEQGKDKATPPAPATPTDEKEGAKDSDSKSDKPTPKLQLGDLPMPPEPKYRELDDDLKEQIRESIMRERAFESMGRAADKAEEFMMDLSVKYGFADKKDREKLAATFPDLLKKYAADNDLEYKETPPMTQMELIGSLDEKIGSATDPRSAGNSFNARSVAEIVFEQSGGRGRAYELSIYAPRRADSLSLTRYSYWKTKEIPAQVADVKDEEVRKKVIKAWKFDKARELANKRAKELADLIKQKPDDISAALGGQTVTGAPDAPAVTVREPKRFSVLRTPESLHQFSMPSAPTFSEIDGVEEPGFSFFKTVFDDLNEGDVGVTANQPQSVIYVVRVHDRDGTPDPKEGVLSLEELQKNFVKEKFNNFLPTPYQYVAAEGQNYVDNQWRSNFMKRFGISSTESNESEAGE